LIENTMLTATLIDTREGIMFLTNVKLVLKSAFFDLGS
jgi:hypothetical protein